MLGAKSERMAADGGEGSDDGKESEAGMGVRRAGAMHKPETASDFQFGHGDLHEFATGELRLDGETGHESDAIAARHEAFDGFEAGQLNPHVEGGLVPGKGLDHPLAERRSDGVRDEVLRAQLADGNLLLFGERMFGVDDKGNGVGVDGNGVEARIFRAEGQDAELDGSLEELIGDLAGQRALHSDANLREIATKLVEHGKEPQAGIFVGSKGEAAAFEGAEFLERGDGFAAQTQQALGVAAQQFAGCGEGAVAGGALKEWLADLVFELANGVTDGGLGAAHAGGRTGKALFFGDGEKRFELIEVHEGVRAGEGIPVI